MFQCQSDNEVISGYKYVLSGNPTAYKVEWVEATSVTVSLADGRFGDGILGDADRPRHAVQRVPGARRLYHETYADIES